MERRDEKQQKKAHGVVDELHVDVDGADAGDEEGDADVGAVEEASVPAPGRYSSASAACENSTRPQSCGAPPFSAIYKENDVNVALRDFAHTSGLRPNLRDSDRNVGFDAHLCVRPSRLT